MFTHIHVASKLASIECRIQYGGMTEGNIELKTLEAECVVNILP